MKRLVVNDARRGSIRPGR